MFMQKATSGKATLERAEGASLLEKLNLATGSQSASTSPKLIGAGSVSAEQNGGCDEHVAILSSQIENLVGEHYGALRSQSETSNLPPPTICHSIPAEKRAMAKDVPADAPGKMTTLLEVPHLGSEKVVSNETKIPFGIPSIFSMPVDFSEQDGVCKGDVNNPLKIEDMRLTAVQTDSTSQNCTATCCQSPPKQWSPEDQKEVVTLSDQVPHIPDFILSAPKIGSNQGLCGLNSLMAPDANHLGRKRFNSSMHDMKASGPRDRFDSTSNLSTNFSLRSDAEERQKRREQEVIEKIQKIWTDMSHMKIEIQSRATAQPSSVHESPLQLQEEATGSVSISQSLGLDIGEPDGGSSLFAAHQETQVRASISRMEKSLEEKFDRAANGSQGDDRVAAIGDMILREMGVTAPSLSLQPQYSSFSVLQREIDQVRQGEEDATEILDELYGAVQRQMAI